MAFPDELLVADERVVERFGPWWIDYVAAEALRFITYIAAFLLYLMLIVPEVANRALVGTIGILLSVVGVGLVLSAVGRALRWATTSYALTDQRLLMRHGVLNRSERTVPLNMIRGIDIRQSLTDRIVGKGDLQVNTAVHEAQGVLVLRDIHRPHDLQRRLRQPS